MNHIMVNSFIQYIDVDNEIQDKSDNKKQGI